MHTSQFNIVLVEPEIPPNTGSIARLCGATNTILHLVKPLGFSTEDKYLKRAGLDYWKYVEIIYWESFDEFLINIDVNRIILLSKKMGKPYTTANFRPGDYLIFGKETKGLPEDILKTHLEKCYTIPMPNKKIRSLNLAMTAGIVLYEAIRQQEATQ